MKFIPIFGLLLHTITPLVWNKVMLLAGNGQICFTLLSMFNDQKKKGGWVVGLINKFPEFMTQGGTWRNGSHTNPPLVVMQVKIKIKDLSLLPLLSLMNEFALVVCRLEMFFFSFSSCPRVGEEDEGETKERPFGNCYSWDKRWGGKEKKKRKDADSILFILVSLGIYRRDSCGPASPLFDARL